MTQREKDYLIDALNSIAVALLNIRDISKSEKEGIFAAINKIKQQNTDLKKG